MSTPNYAQPQTKSSRQPLWIILAAVGGFIVVSSMFLMLLVTTGVFVGLNTFFHETDQPTPVAAHYYLSIMEQNYTQAYADLDSHATINGQQLDQQAFVQRASAADAQNGRVRGYVIDTPGNDPSQMTLTIQRNSSYTVHLQLKQEGNVWKIISVDGI